MLSHSLDRGVLVCTVLDDPQNRRCAELAGLIVDLARVHQPAPVVLVVNDAAATAATAEAVLRAQSPCSELGVVLSVATHSAPFRRLLEAEGGGPDVTRLVVHTRIDTALTAAAALTP